jgi:hypothetical protein
LDIAARIFGYLNQGRVFAGLVRFSDGGLVGPPPTPLSFRVTGGQPDPEHRPFYPANTLRKFYHHKTGSQELTPPHPDIKADQRRTVRPLPPGTTFTFTVDFENLRDEELNLLLYCLVLEEEVQVVLSQEALSPAVEGPVRLTGPMRHKLGGCKPQGAGSVHIRLDRMELCQDLGTRYRGGGAAPSSLEGEALKAEVARRTQLIVGRGDDTMCYLRAMLVYSAADPRAGALDYPTYTWFQQDKHNPQKTLLKPVL